MSLSRDTLKPEHTHPSETESDHHFEPLDFTVGEGRELVFWASRQTPCTTQSDVPAGSKAQSGHTYAFETDRIRLIDCQSLYSDHARLWGGLAFRSPCSLSPLSAS